jgi:roadblock/LC7 domain-containing protein
MPAKTHGERLDRLEQVVGILAEDQVSLQRLIAELATETRRGFDQVAARFDAATKRMDEDQARTEERFREMAHQNAQRSRELDDRVDKLVLAIGEFIRNQNAPRA